MSAQDDAGTTAVAAALPAALAQRTPEALAPLLDHDVRWGGPEDTEQTCHNRDEVLTFYRRLLDDDVHIEIRDALADGDRMHLRVRVGWPSPEEGPREPVEEQTVATVRDGRIVELLGLGDDVPLVELLYVDDCPNRAAFLPHLRSVLHAARVPAAIHLIRVVDGEQAQQLAFLGSPSLRINGRDVEPGADRRQDYGLQCRVYDAPTGLTGIPPDEWIRRALAEDQPEKESM